MSEVHIEVHIVVQIEVQVHRRGLFLMSEVPLHNTSTGATSCPCWFRPVTNVGFGPQTMLVAVRNK